MWKTIQTFSKRGTGENTAIWCVPECLRLAYKYRSRKRVFDKSTTGECDALVHCQVHCCLRSAQIKFCVMILRSTFCLFSGSHQFLLQICATCCELRLHHAGSYELYHRQCVLFSIFNLDLAIALYR